MCWCVECLCRVYQCLKMWFADFVCYQMWDAVIELYSHIFSWIRLEIKERIDKWYQSSLFGCDDGCASEERFTSCESKCLQKCWGHDEEVWCCYLSEYIFFVLSSVMHDVLWVCCSELLYLVCIESFAIYINMKWDSIMDESLRCTDNVFDAFLFIESPHIYQSIVHCGSRLLNDKFSLAIW